MLKLSAFADEIGPDLNEQIRHCKLNGITHFELRGVQGKNVMDFTPELRAEIRTRLAENEMGVICIGSPIGKTAVDQPWSADFDRFKRAVELAAYFNSPFIRVFSYYPAGGEGHGPVEPHRDEVIDRFRRKIDYVKTTPIVLLHENEKGIYGDIGARCLDLLRTIDDPKLRAAFDFANFVQCGENPLDNWRLLKPYVAHIHIKDAKAGGGRVVAAGRGDGHISEILTDAWRSGYRGFLALEPHLKVAGHSHGETGPELFKTAVDALKDLCRGAQIPLA